MDRVEIPENLISKLGPEMKMDVHWVDVACANNQKYYGVVVRGGKYITGFKSDINGTSDLPFTSTQIANIRRQALFKWWPIW